MALRVRLHLMYTEGYPVERSNNMGSKRSLYVCQYICHSDKRARHENQVVKVTFV